MEKICQVCKKIFMSSFRQSRIQKYCSKECRLVARNKRRNKGINKKSGIKFKSTSREYHKAYAIKIQASKLRNKYHTNPEYRKKVLEMIKRSMKKGYDKLKNDVYQKLGRKCVYCGCDVYEALEINHINGGGSKEFSTGKNHKSHRVFYLEILNNKRQDLEIVCRPCNAVHWLKSKGIVGHKVSWNME